MRSIRAFVLVASGVVAACSSSSGGSGNGAASGSCSPGAGCHDTCDPCSQLTSAQIAMVVGVSVDSGSLATAGSCVWTYTVNSQQELSVELSTNLKPTTFDDLCNSANTVGYTVAKVNGVGDAACSWVPGSGSSPLLSTQLNFEKNCWGYTLSMTAQGPLASMFPAATILQDETTLAQSIVAKY